MTSQISNLIAEALADLAVVALQDNVTDSNERAGLVRVGELQDDPESFRISVLAHPEGDVTNARWTDCAVAFPEETPFPRYLNMPAFEIGGGYGRTMWYRRGAIEFKVFLTRTRENRDSARQIAYSVLGRVEYTIGHTDLDLTDDFGELVVMSPKPMKSRMEEGGGPPDSFIWTGWVLYQAVTERGY